MPLNHRRLTVCVTSGFLTQPNMHLSSESLMSKAHNARWVLLTAAVGAAWWIEKFVTLEWSYPYCSVMDNGEAAAVFGFPLPYVQASIVTSVTEFFIPWLYVVNLAAITAGIFFALRPVAYRLAGSNLHGLRIIACVAAALLLVTAVAFEAMFLSMGVWRPHASFDGAPPYSELRPVAVRMFGRQRDCTASQFWYPGPRTRIQKSGRLVTQTVSLRRR